MDTETQEVAERVRAALVRAALAAYEDAAMRGLCCEGAWEAAVAAVRGLDLSRALDVERDGPGPASPA